jgi:hypothetical protein
MRGLREREDVYPLVKGYQSLKFSVNKKGFELRLFLLISCYHFATITSQNNIKQGITRVN